MNLHYTRRRMITLHDFESVLRWPLDTSLWAQIHGHGFWLVCEVALTSNLQDSQIDSLLFTH